MTADATIYDVVIVGAGPTGLVAANALGATGARVLVVEREAGVAELPRAVSIDDEAMRLMQRLGLRAQTESITFAGTGTKYYGADGRLLVYARGPQTPRYGFPVKNPIDHPEFQQLLLDGARRFETVDIRHHTQFVALSQRERSVDVELVGPQGPYSVVSRYVLGCDGGRSPVRLAIGQEPMRGSAFAERWLVVDTIRDPHRERYAMHYGDPVRPHVVIVGREGRCRYEFLVAEREVGDPVELTHFARRLVAPFRELPLRDIVRCTVYQFYALVAECWKVGRVFLAGDAAHMMPPFAGQGLNSGLRDASNLAWKLALVLRRDAGEELLQSYEAERKPHVEATVALSVRLGKVMMGRSSRRAAMRDAVLTTGRRVPPVRRFFAEMKFRPDPFYANGFATGAEDGLTGTQLYQPRVLTESLTPVDLDDLLGDRFALLGLDVAPGLVRDLAHPLWDRLRALRIVVRLQDRLPSWDQGVLEVSDADGALERQASAFTGTVLVVRPDRYVAGQFDPRTGEGRCARALEQRLGWPAPSAVAESVA